MTMTPERWDFLDDYSREVFGAEDDHLSGLMDEAVAAGLPDIAVTADVGRLLHILTADDQRPAGSRGRHPGRLFRDLDRPRPATNTES